MYYHGVNKTLVIKVRVQFWATGTDRRIKVKWDNRYRQEDQGKVG